MRTSLALPRPEHSVAVAERFDLNLDTIERLINRANPAECHWNKTRGRAASRIDTHETWYFRLKKYGLRGAAARVSASDFSGRLRCQADLAGNNLPREQRLPRTPRH